jgi:hypothetical protein
MSPAPLQLNHTYTEREIITLVDLLRSRWEKTYPRPIVIGHPALDDLGPIDRATLKRRGVVGGLPPLQIVTRRYSYWVTLKAPSVRRMDPGRQLYENLVLLGHVVIVAESAREALGLLEEMGIP